MLIWALVLRSRYKKLDAERRRDEEIEHDVCLPFVLAQEKAPDESLGTLRANIESRNYLYKLPWYLVLEQEDAGKMSFINRLNQNFSLTSVTKAGKKETCPTNLWPIPSIGG